MQRQDALLSRWRAHPDADTTIALCGEAGNALGEQLVREIGSLAEQRHSARIDVMTAVGRMYLAAGLLSDAQNTLVQAGKIDARDPRPFAVLGQVLLHRGDAQRAEKVLSRAVELGDRERETADWLSRATSLCALQAKAGMQGVSAELARMNAAQRAGATHGARGVRPLSTVPPPKPPRKSVQPLRGDGNAARPGPARFSPPTPAHFGGPTASAPSFDSYQEISSVDEVSDSFAALGPGAVSYEEISAVEEVDPRHSYEETTTPGALDSYSEITVVARDTGLGNGRSALAAPRLPALGSPGHISAQHDSVVHEEPTFKRPMSFAPSRAPLPPPPRAPGRSDGVQAGGQSSRRRETMQARWVNDEAPDADPHVVLEHLARVGVYEPRTGAAPSWERAPKQRSRATWVLALATVLVVGSGWGAYVYSKRVKEERLAKASALDDQVVKLLRSGRLADIKTSDAKLSAAFELDSHSPRTAKLWLHDRIIASLLDPAPVNGVDSAVYRARQAGVPEVELAAGRIAALLEDGEVASAAGLLPKWDVATKKDAIYCLASGAALERAGDVRAIERYEKAVALDPKLMPARLLLARLLLIEFGVEKANAAVEGVKAEAPGDALARAVSALAWAVDPARPAELPSELRLTPEERALLPAPLAPVPYMVSAIEAMGTGNRKQAIQEIGLALPLTDSPATATRIGFMAIQTGDEMLARSAALRAVQFSAIYPAARVLAARVALLGGRLDEAKKAIENLDPTMADVAIVSGVVAYETFDPSELRAAVERLSGDSGGAPEYDALLAAPQVLSGAARLDSAAIEKMATPAVPWGEIVSVDAALNAGAIDLAAKLTAEWNVAGRPAYAQRVARLRRYQSKLEEAAQLAEQAIRDGATPGVLIETVYALLDAKRTAEARTLLTRYPALLGPSTGWLGALVDVATGHADDAKVKVSQLDLPPATAPLPLRVLSARALAASKDRRTREFLTVLARQFKRHPDVLRAAEDAKK